MTIEVRNGAIVSVVGLPDRRFLALEAAVSALLGLANAFVAARWDSSDPRGIAALLVPALVCLLFVAYAIWTVSGILMPRAAIRVDEKGIHLPYGGGVRLPWAAVNGAHLEQSARWFSLFVGPLEQYVKAERLHIGLVPPDALDRLARGWRGLRTRRDRVSGGRELLLRVDRLAVSGRAVLECIDVHLARHGLGGAKGI